MIGFSGTGPWCLVAAGLVSYPAAPEAVRPVDLPPAGRARISAGIPAWTSGAGSLTFTRPPAFWSLMIEGMSRAEILESLPDGFCDDCWQQSLDRQKKFSTEPEKDYHWVYYVTHIWDGI